MIKENKTDVGYKASPFGQIPIDWEIIELDKYGKFSKGKGILKEQVISEGLPCVRYGELYTTHDFIIKDFKSFINSEVAKESKEINPGDILFAGSGETIEEIGKSAAYLGSELAYAGGDVIIFSPNSTVNSICLSYLLETDHARKQKRRLGQGNSVVHIYPSDLALIKLISPPLPEQTAIANLLSTWDNAIQTTNTLIEQKQNRKKWLMQMLLSGKKRLKGFEKEKWFKKRIGEYLVKHDEKSTENNQYPVLTSSRRGIFLQKDYYTRDVASEDNTGYNVVPRGYFTFRHMSDDLIFKFNINNIVDRGIVSTLYPVFTVKNINKDFLWYKLNEGNEFRIHALEQKQGGSRTYVYFSTLAELKINLPSLDEQNAITKVLQTADREITLAQNKLDQLKEQKKGLMQILLTGKKRLKIK
jgi:type I restriction enzyme, S subunit